MNGDKLQYIGQDELTWAGVPYCTCPEIFMDRKVIHYIDNTSAIAALVKGYSKKMDSGMIVNATHAALLGLGAEVYFDYVRSKRGILQIGRHVVRYPGRSECCRR